jgi:hypothetical protein
MFEYSEVKCIWVLEVGLVRCRPKSRMEVCKGAGVLEGMASKEAGRTDK